MKVFSNDKCELGEAPLWHSKRNSILWLDILNRNLFEKCFDSQNSKADRVWQLPEYASAMAEDQYDENFVWMVTNTSFGKFDLSKSNYKPVLDLQLGSSYRANDGGVSPDGAFWFGTMEWSPTGINGSVYSISKRAVLQKQDIRIGIPNTFCWNPDGSMIYISDSYRQKLLMFNIENNMLEAESLRVFVDLSDGISTPDGGALDGGGFLWNAHWDGHKVVKYNVYGETCEELPMPVPRPTSCCFGGPEYRHLFVTSARVEMDEEHIEQFPDSGNLFVAEQMSPGIKSLPFSLET